MIRIVLTKVILIFYMLLFSFKTPEARDFSMKKAQLVLDSNFFLDEETISYLNINVEYIKNPMKVHIVSRLKFKDESPENFIVSQGYLSYYWRRGVEIKGGKQRYNLGRGLIWNPIDFIDFPESLFPGYLAEGKGGIDIGLILHPKISSSIAMYFDDSRLLFFNKYEIHLSAFDITFLVSNDRENKFHLGVDFIRTITQNIYYHLNGDIYKDNDEIEWRGERGMRFIIPQYNLYLTLSYLGNSQGYRLEEDKVKGISKWIGKYLGISLSKYNIFFLGGDIKLKALYTINLDDKEYLATIGITWTGSDLFFNPQYFHSSEKKIIKIILGYHLPWS